jgi:hypothetical protein
MNDAITQQAIDTFEPILRRLALEHGNEKGARLFIRAMIARGGRTAGQFAVYFVCFLCAKDGITPLASIKAMADCASNPEAYKAARRLA